MLPQHQGWELLYSKRHQEKLFLRSLVNQDKKASGRRAVVGLCLQAVLFCRDYLT
jgi:predicted nucleotidyltransferase